MKSCTNRGLALSLTALLCCAIAKAQNNFTIKGKLPLTKETEVRIMGYTGFKDSIIADTKTDATGNFTLSYPKKYTGAALLQIKENPSIVVLLNKENFGIDWKDFADYGTLRFSGSRENDSFNEAVTINQEADKKLAALRYLKPLYENAGTASNGFYGQLVNEIETNSRRLEDYRNNLPADAYAKDYLKYRKLLQDIKSIKNDKDFLPLAENGFSTLSFGGPLYRSGLMKEMFDAYLEMILDKKNNLQDKEQEFISLNESLLTRITAKPNSGTTANPVSEYLFKYYEKYGLTKVSGHLALLALEGKKFTPDSQRTVLFEQYRKMAVSSTAPQLALTNCNKGYTSTAALKNKYTVVVFGASGCDLCTTELPQFDSYATDFKQKYDADIVFIALDTDKEAYNAFIKDKKIIASCDFMGWDGKNVKNYYVSATPTIYILDGSSKIAAKPSSAIEAAKWLSENAVKP